MRVLSACLLCGALMLGSAECCLDDRRLRTNVCERPLGGQGPAGSRGWTPEFTSVHPAGDTKAVLPVSVTGGQKSDTCCMALAGRSDAGGVALQSPIVQKIWKACCTALAIDPSSLNMGKARLSPITSPYNVTTLSAHRQMRSLQDVTPLVVAPVLTSATNNFTIAYAANVQVFVHTESAEGSEWTSASTGLLVGAVLAVGVLLCSTSCVYCIIRRYGMRKQSVDAYRMVARTRGGGRSSKQCSKRWRHTAEDESTTSSMDESDAGSFTALLLNHPCESVKVGINGAARVPDEAATGLTEQSYQHNCESSASTLAKSGRHRELCKCSQPCSSTVSLQPMSSSGANASYQYSAPDEQGKDEQNISGFVKRSDSFGVRDCSCHTQRTHSSSGAGVSFYASLAPLSSDTSASGAYLSSDTSASVRLPVKFPGAANPPPVDSSQCHEYVRHPASVCNPQRTEAAASSAPRELTRARCTSHASRSSSADDMHCLATSAVNELLAASNRMAYLKDEMVASDASCDGHLSAMVDFLPTSAPTSHREVTDVIDSKAARVASPALAVMPSRGPVEVDDPSRESP